MSQSNNEIFVIENIIAEFGARRRMDLSKLLPEGYRLHSVKYAATDVSIPFVEPIKPPSPINQFYPMFCMYWKDELIIFSKKKDPYVVIDIYYTLPNKTNDIDSNDIDPLLRCDDCGLLYLRRNIFVVTEGTTPKYLCNACYQYHKPLPEYTCSVCGFKTTDPNKIFRKGGNYYCATHLTSLLKEDVKSRCDSCGKEFPVAEIITMPFGKLNHVCKGCHNSINMQVDLAAKIPDAKPAHKIVKPDICYGCIRETKAKSDGCGHMTHPLSEKYCEVRLPRLPRNGLYNEIPGAYSICSVCSYNYNFCKLRNSCSIRLNQQTIDELVDKLHTSKDNQTAQKSKQESEPTPERTISFTLPEYFMEMLIERAKRYPTTPPKPPFPTWEEWRNKHFAEYATKHYSKFSTDSSPIGFVFTQKITIDDLYKQWERQYAKAKTKYEKEK